MRDYSQKRSLRRVQSKGKGLSSGAGLPSVPSLSRLDKEQLVKQVGGRQVQQSSAVHGTVTCRRWRYAFAVCDCVIDDRLTSIRCALYLMHTLAQSHAVTSALPSSSITTQPSMTAGAGDGDTRDGQCCADGEAARAPQCVSSAMITWQNMGPHIYHRRYSSKDVWASAGWMLDTQ